MRTRSDSARFALTEAKALAEPLPTPPQPLTPAAMAHWPAIITAKRAAAWTDSDLLIACQIARDHADIAQMNLDLAEEGSILVRETSGMKYPNPLCNLIDKASRRILVNCRALQIHGIATTGKTDHAKNKNEAVRALAGKIEQADSDLIARVFN